jgi:hypothetical protein
MVQPHPSCCDPKEPSLWVVLHGRLNNIALIPTIKEDIIAAQRTDAGMGHLRQRMESGEAQCFRQDADGVLWFNNSIWVIVDCFTKLAHFITIATTYRVGQYAELYISHIVCYHDIPKTIISDGGSIFVAHFWEQLHEYLHTHLIRSSAYHPQTDGQMERVNQIIKDMLRACVLMDGLKWDKHLPLSEFSYNNSYQESIKMPPFEALYG